MLLLFLSLACTITDTLDTSLPIIDTATGYTGATATTGATGATGHTGTNVDTDPGTPDPVTGDTATP